VQSLYISFASLALDFLPKLALEYVASQEHRLMTNIIIFVRKREALALRNYQRDFMTKLEKNRINQELG